MTDKDNDKTTGTTGSSPAAAGSTGGGTASSMGASSTGTAGTGGSTSSATAGSTLGSSASSTTPTPDPSKPAVGTTASSASAGTTSGGSQSDSEKTAADMAKETKDAAADRAGELSEQAKSKAADAKDYARDVAEDRFRQGKDYASSEVEAQAARIRAAGSEWGDDSYPAQAAGYLADGLSQAAEAIRDQDLNGLMDDVTQFARRNPGVFLGGAALLGFAIARVMKASERADYREPRYGASGHGPSYDAYGRGEFDAPAPGVSNTPYDRPVAGAGNRRYMS